MRLNSHYEDHTHHPDPGSCEWCNYRHRTSVWITLAVLAIGLLFLLAVFGVRHLLELGFAVFFLGWGFMRLREGGFLRREKKSKDRSINTES